MVLRNGVVVPKSVREQKTVNVNTFTNAYFGMQQDFNSGDIVQIGTSHDSGNAIQLTYRYAVFGLQQID